MAEQKQRKPRQRVRWLRVVGAVCGIVCLVGALYLGSCAITQSWGVADVSSMVLADVRATYPHKPVCHAYGSSEWPFLVRVRFSAGEMEKWQVFDQRGTREYLWFFGWKRLLNEST